MNNGYRSSILSYFIRLGFFELSEMLLNLVKDLSLGTLGVQLYHQILFPEKKTGQSLRRLWLVYYGRRTCFLTCNAQ